MVKKFCIGFCLFLFTQQEYFAMYNQSVGAAQQKSTWQKVNEWVNGDANNAPKLWWLWPVVDNVPFQYGNSKIWEHGEAYYGLSNGIGFFPSILNFGWMKIGIIDLHFNVVNTVIDFLRNCIRWFATGNNNDRGKIVRKFLFLDFAGSGTHLLSFKIFNGIKIRLISIIASIIVCIDKSERKKIFKTNEITKSWYHRDLSSVSNTYLIFLPQIEINIPALIKYFKNL